MKGTLYREQEQNVIEAEHKVLVEDKKLKMINWVEYISQELEYLNFKQPIFRLSKQCLIQFLDFVILSSKTESPQM